VHLQHKPLDIITLFHKASSPASVRLAAALRQASAAASETSTEDQASDHSAQSQAARREEFKLEITESPPTPDQLQTILEYVGQSRIPSIVKGATTQKEALRKFQESVENFQRPVVRRRDCAILFCVHYVWLIFDTLCRLSTGTTARRRLVRTSPRFSR
jgi:hypothetical protein